MASPESPVACSPDPDAAARAGGLRIGDVALPSRALLAPVAGYTDLPFRLLCRSLGGVGLASTDLLNCRAVLMERKRSLDLAATAPGDEPLCMQLYGNHTDPLPEAAVWAAERGARIIDLNMGCPVDKVCKKNGGSLLLCDPDTTVDLARRVVRAAETCGRPVTAKLRLGWDAGRIVAPELARRLVDVGIAAITIHGRTTEQRFKGTVDLDGIARVRAAVPDAPVIGNGDIQDAADARRMMQRTGVDGVMIARAALRRPWIFASVAAALDGRPEPAEPTVAEKIAVVRQHLDGILTHQDAVQARRCLRQRIAWYGKSMGHVRPLKEAIRTAPSAEVIRGAIDAYDAFVAGLEPAATVPHWHRHGPEDWDRTLEGLGHADAARTHRSNEEFVQRSLAGPDRLR